MVTYAPIVIGRDKLSGKDQVLPFTDAAVYLIGGASGGGKSNLEEIIMGQLAVDESTRIFGCDGKGARKDWGRFADRCEQWVWPREDPDCSQYMQMLRDAYAEVERRYDQPGQYPRFVLFLEEAGNQRDRVIAAGGTTLCNEHDQLLKMYAQTCRDANALLVISLQRPEAESLSTNVRSNAGVRICLPVDNEVTAKMVLGSIDGVSLPTGQGNAVVRMPVLGGPDRYVLIDYFPPERWRRFCESLPSVRLPATEQDAPQDAPAKPTTLEAWLPELVKEDMYVSDLWKALPDVKAIRGGNEAALGKKLKGLKIETESDGVGRVIRPEMLSVLLSAPTDSSPRFCRSLTGDPSDSLGNPPAVSAVRPAARDR